MNDFKKIPVDEQMENARYNAKLGRYERIENGQWVDWPVLRIDGAGARHAKKEIQGDRRPRRTEA